MFFALATFTSSAAALMAAFPEVAIQLLACSPCAQRSAWQVRAFMLRFLRCDRHPSDVGSCAAKPGKACRVSSRTFAAQSLSSCLDTCCRRHPQLTTAYASLASRILRRECHNHGLLVQGHLRDTSHRHGQQATRKNCWADKARSCLLPGYF